MNFSEPKSYLYNKEDATHFKCEDIDNVKFATEFFFVEFCSCVANRNGAATSKNHI